VVVARTVVINMDRQIVTLDVREEMRNGNEPFSRIMAAVDSLGESEDLRIIAPFEPVPLFAVMAERGFAHSPKRIGAGDWEVVFSRAVTEDSAALPDREPSASIPRPVIEEVDARGLEPPQPMVVILEALAGLAEGARLHARTDRRPMHLYSQLELRGFAGETEEQEDGSFITHIWRT
jgi:uncharacterized protein (DUF2249 family)